MDKFFSPFQSSFIPRRRATDNVVVLREAMTKLKRKKGAKVLIVLKLDLEKAYD